MPNGKFSAFKLLIEGQTSTFCPFWDIKRNSFRINTPRGHIKDICPFKHLLIFCDFVKSGRPYRLNNIIISEYSLLFAFQYFLFWPLGAPFLNPRTRKISLNFIPLLVRLIMTRYNHKYKHIWILLCPCCPLKKEEGGQAPSHYGVKISMLLSDGFPLCKITQPKGSSKRAKPSIFRCK